MPNHVTNIMTVSGPAEKMADLKAVWFNQEAPDGGKHSLDYPDVSVDFNRLMPMPEDLDIAAGSSVTAAMQWLTLKNDWLLSGKEMAERGYVSKLKEYTGELLDWQTDTVGRLKEVVAATPGLLEKIGLDRRYLEQIRNNINAYGAPTWYEWRRRKWGTKWNAYSQYLAEWSDTSFRILFDTAWTPPEPLFVLLSECFPELDMQVRYIDEGGGFAGTFTASGGVFDDAPCADCDFRDFAEEHFGWTFDDDDDDADESGGDAQTLPVSA